MALEFDGVNQYIQITQAKDLPIYNKGAYSICGWVKAPEQEGKRIFTEGSTSSVYPVFSMASGVAGNTLKLLVYIRDDANNTKLGSGGLPVSTITIFDNNWHHFAWVDNNGTAKLYIDGALDATNFNYSRSGTFTLNRTCVAALVQSAISGFLDGELFDVRCYNRCLSANEIAEIYFKRGADRVCQGLVGQWRLDDLPSGTPAPLLLDPMDSASGYTTGTYGNVSLNTTTYKEGSGGLNVNKTTTVADYFGFRKTITAINVSGQIIKLWAYIKDATTLNKISSIGYRLYSTFNTDGKSTLFGSLSVGWNLLLRHIDAFESPIGSFDPTAVTELYYILKTKNNSDTTSEGDVIFDFFRAGDYPFQVPDLSGNGNHGTPYSSPVYRESPHRLRRGVLIS